MLEIRNLEKRYQGVRALQDVSLTLKRGEIIGLFGENGAGKTTLMKCILGLTSVQAGEITLDGEKISRKNITKLSFATCEHSFFPSLTPADHEVFYKDHFLSFRKKRFDALLDFFELPKNRALKTFSSGQKNQFEVILALCQGAEYILMDEPFAGNDIFNREDFYKVLAGILEPTETILLSTHLLEEIENFIGRAILLRKGKITGDITTMALMEEEKSLVDYVKEIYQYQPDRVSRSLSALAGDDRQS